ncbi:RICIN domain-containing protein [Methylomagnum sp.]
MSIDPRQPLVRVRIKNVKSGRYLSLEGGPSNWRNDDTSLSIKDWLGSDVKTLESPQVWNIIQYRESSWIILNQHSMHIACIRGRETGNGATAIQYHTQGFSFQEWRFNPLQNGHWLIQNINSGRYLGPQGRETRNDHFCIQYDDQTREDNYQEWTFELCTPDGFPEGQGKRRNAATHPVPHVVHRAAPKGPIPDGLKVAAISGPNSLEPTHTSPALVIGSFALWPFSYLDNRVSFGMVMYDPHKQVLKQVEKPGARYVYKITVNAADQSVTFWGQGNQSVTMTLAEINQMMLNAS